MRKLLILIATMLGLATVAQAAPVKTPHVTADLIAETAGAAPGSTLYVALRQRIIPKWHTYWRNPGDSGEPTTIKWTLPRGWSAGEIVWPAPSRIPVGPLTNYGFSGEVLLPIPITVPASARAGERVTLTAQATWLVCEEVCIPEQGTLTLEIPVVAGSPTPDGADGEAIARTLAAAPKPAGLTARFTADKAALRLAVTGAGVAGADVGKAWFFPYDGTVIDHAGAQKAARGRDGLTLELPAGAAVQSGQAVTALAGVLTLGDGRAFEVTAQPGPLPPGATGLTPLAVTTPDDGHGLGGPSASGAGGTATAHGPGSLLLYAGFALLGGLILNLMPCVFPVLAMKAAALARHGDSPREARAEGLAYGAGVIATFLALAGALLAARAAGQAVGWGFQLQSPGVVAALSLLMLLVALNLSGVFEIGTSAQNAGSGLASRSGLAGAFFTGALAVVVAAPCTAPFMAGAIGWAVTQSAPAALLVFGALGVGLALPFVALAFAPGLQRRMPKPGAWMDGLRKLLAFPMYGTAAWLAWVFANQAGTGALAELFAFALLIAFAAWLFGARQRGARRWWVTVPAVAAGLLATVGLAVAGVRTANLPPAAPGAAALQSPTAAKESLAAEPWSPARVAALRAEGRPVFVDFTADWCITCKVNERTTLASAGVRDAFAKHKAAYLVADWTKRDALIAQTLSAHGRSGVPLYLLYDAKGSPEPKILPQLLTEGGVVAALNDAARS